MSERNRVTVKDLLPDEMKQMDDVLKAELKSTGAEGVPQFAWRVIGQKATDAVREEMDGENVYMLLAKAWCEAKELSEYTDKELHPPTQESNVCLGKHSVTSRLYPTIVVAVAGKELPPVKLTLELRADFRAAALAIKDGYIRSVSSGDCSVSAQLKYGEMPLHKELTSKPALLPGTLSFPEPGLRIHKAKGSRSQVHD